MLGFLLLLTPAADPDSPRYALKPFNVLVGTWKGTGQPDGPNRAKEFWTESVAWEWQFKGTDAWLVATFEKSKHFTKAELRYVAADKSFQLTATSPDKQTHTYTGSLTAGKNKEQVLAVERTDDAAKRVERLVFTLLHHNRHLYRLDAKPIGAAAFTRQYQVGATKEGEAFAQLPAERECIVSGGRGTIPVSHKGVTYYVCCSGCRDAFKDEPDKYVKEFEDKQKNKK